MDLKSGRHKWMNFSIVTAMVPMEETLRMLHSVTMTDEELGVTADAMEYLTVVIGVASGLVEDYPIQ